MALNDQNDADAPQMSDRSHRTFRVECQGDKATLLPSGETWRLVHESGEEFVVHCTGPLRANNADALTPALYAGLGIAVQPDFIYWRDVAAGGWK